MGFLFRLNVATTSALGEDRPDGLEVPNFSPALLSNRDSPGLAGSKLHIPIGRKRRNKAGDAIDNLLKIGLAPPKCFLRPLQVIDVRESCIPADNPVRRSLSARPRG